MQKEGGILVLLIVGILLTGLANWFPPLICESEVVDVMEMKNEEHMSEQVQSLLQCQFYENDGQIRNADLNFYGRVGGGTIGFGTSKVYLWTGDAENPVTISFENAEISAPRPTNEVSQRTNFFLGSRGEHANIRAYTGIIYDSLWPGISLVYKGTAHGAKYEFRIAPNADPSNIRIRLRGHAYASIESDSLRVGTSQGEFVDAGLVGFQEGLQISAEFVKLGHDTIGFRLGQYDRSKELVIDPLLFSTYIGGSDYDSIGPITVDNDGYIYAVGRTYSWDFPTDNAFQDTHSPANIGPTDCVVLKLTPECDSLVYSTYIGGSTDDGASNIQIDTEGNVYVAGQTWSSDFPTTVGAFNRSHGGKNDCFAFKLNATGNGLVYSTFIGGSEYDERLRTVIDTSGAITIAGTTSSSDFPTVNAFDGVFDEQTECFLLRLTPGGDSLEFSTFVGGNGREEPSSIALDSSGNIHVFGESIIQDEYSWYYTSDCFLLKIMSDGTEMLNQKSLGGSSSDRFDRVIVDSSDCAFAVGTTESPDFPTANAYDDSFNGGHSDLFVLKLNLTDGSLIYSTFIGGMNSDYGGGIAIDSEGNAYVAASTESVNFPTVAAFQSRHKGMNEAVIFKLNSEGNTLLYSTFVGGSHSDYGGSIVRDGMGNLYVSGGTWSSDFPTKNALDDTLGGNRDGFILRLPDLTDSDGDMLIDYLEIQLGTQIDNPDSDGDSCPDGWEFRSGFDANNHMVPLIYLFATYMGLAVFGVLIYVNRSTLAADRAPGFRIQCSNCGTSLFYPSHTFTDEGLVQCRACARWMPTPDAEEGVTIPPSPEEQLVSSYVPWNERTRASSNIVYDLGKFSLHGIAFTLVLSGYGILIVFGLVFTFLYRLGLLFWYTFYIGDIILLIIMAIFLAFVFGGLNVLLAKGLWSIVCRRRLRSIFGHGLTLLAILVVLNAPAPIASNLLVPYFYSVANYVSFWILLVPFSLLNGAVARRIAVSFEIRVR